MAINIRNRPNDADSYKIVDLAIASNTESNYGVKYDTALNTTTINVAAADKNHDYLKIGQYMIPQRFDCPNKNSPSVQFNVIHPLRELQIRGLKTFGTDLNNPTRRTITFDGDQRRYFARFGSPARSPQGFGLDDIKVSDIVRGRKYRITGVNQTRWAKFGRLYQDSTDKETGRKLAIVGTTFTATASGKSTTGEDASPPLFRTSRYEGVVGTSDSPYIIYGLTRTDKSRVNGTYNKITESLYHHASEPISLELRGQRKQWTIYDRITGEIFYEDSNTTSMSTGAQRFDSPKTADSPNQRPAGGNTPSVVWQDRTVSVPTDDHYKTGDPDDEGTVVEVIHFSSIYSDSNPLTNREIDQNFIDLETKKLASDGSQPLDGKLAVLGDISGYNLTISDKINIGGVTPYSTNTAIALGDRDLEVNNIRLSGTINDDALFRKYNITAFPHSFLADYNTGQKRLEPMVILYFANVSEFAVDGGTITGVSSGKTGKVRRINTEYGYIMVKETSSNKSFQVGEKIDGKQLAGPILRVLEPSDYLIAGQNVKIFGMNQHDTPLANYYAEIPDVATAKRPSKPSAPTVEVRGTASGSITYNYRIATMNKYTGKMSELSDASSSAVHVDLVEMDKANYIRLSNISRGHATNLLLVYRKTSQGSGGTDYRLINIFDNSKLGDSTDGIAVEDYGAYDKTTWGYNSSPANQYAINRKSGMVYVPTNYDDSILTNGEAATTKEVLPFVGSSAKYKVGFLESRITSAGVVKTSNVNSNSSPAYFQIPEMTVMNGLVRQPNIEGDHDALHGDAEEIYASPAGYSTAAGFSNHAPYGKANEVEFFIDNGRIVNSPAGEIVGGLQKLILDAAASGRRSTTLPGGTFFTKMLTLPSNFKLQGQSKDTTVLKSMPWNGDFLNVKNVSAGNVGSFTGVNDYTAQAGYSPKYTITYFPETATGELRNQQSGSINRFATVVTKDQAQIGTTNGRPDGSAGVFSGLLTGTISYARALIDFDGKTGVTVANLKLDGNGINNTAQKVDVSGKSNFLLTGQLSSNCFLDNIKLEDSTLSGCYLEETEDMQIEGSVIKKGGSVISQSAFATGIFAPDSTKLRMSSNLIENWSESNDLTSNLNTVLSGNMFRNTGSGVLAYATSNLVKESNLILGPNDEFIPMVDTLNSEYDQINIDLGQDTTDYISDTIEFNRDDSPVDLRPPNASTGFDGINIISEIRTLVQQGTRQYLLPKTTEAKNFDYTFRGDGGSTYAIVTGVVADNPGDGTASLQAGNFNVKITAASITALGTYAAGTGQNNLQVKYDSLNERPAGESLVGLVFTLKGKEMLYLGDDEAAVASDGSTNDIKWTAVKVNKTANEIVFRISDDKASLLAIGDRIVWRVGVDQTGTLGGIETAAFKTRTGSNGDSNSNPLRVTYPIKAKNVQAGYADITIGIGTADGIEGAEVASLTSTGENLIDITTLGNPAQVAECRLGLENNFILAKGRILI